MPFSLSGIGLSGICSVVPSQKEDNAELIQIPKKNREELIEKTGIRFRHIAPNEVCTSDLCYEAAAKILDELNWTRESIDALVVITQTPDHPIPGIATQLQFRLNLRQSCITLDVNHGCSGYVYGLSTLGGLMKAYGLKRGLLLVGDTISKTISKSDYSLYPIFSDGGTATALESDGTAASMQFLMGSKGADYKTIYIPHGGSRHPVSPESMDEVEEAPGIKRKPIHLAMKGHDVFTFGLTTVASSIMELMADSNTQAQEIDYLVLHQANKLLLDAIGRKTGITSERIPSSLYNFGNTSCATIPITLTSQLRGKLSESEQLLLLSGFGVGLTWGNVLLRTGPIACPEMIYL